MKKSIIIGLIMAILTIASFPVYAANENPGPTFYTGTYITAERGNTVTVPISANNNPGFAAVGLVVTYDPGVLQITGVTAPVSSMSLNEYFALTTSPGTQWISLVNPSAADWNGNGLVANVIFNVKSDAQTGISYIGLSFTSSPDGTPCNSNGNLLTDSATYSGSVNIVAASVPQYVPPNVSSPSQSTTSSNPTPTPTPTPAPTPVPTQTPYYPADDQTVTPSETEANFIGISPSLPDASGADIEYLANVTGSESSNATPNTITASQNYGVVPQTGVADILVLAIVLGISLAASTVVWVRVIRKRVKN